MARVRQRLLTPCAVTDPTFSTASPRLTGVTALFLVDGYALIYRAFFALISRPLTTSTRREHVGRMGNRQLPATAPRRITAGVPRLGARLRAVVPARAVSRVQGHPREADRGAAVGLRHAGWSGSASSSKRTAFRSSRSRLRGRRRDRHARACRRADQGINVVIVSGDKDFQQLVRPRRLAVESRPRRSGERRRAMGLASRTAANGSACRRSTSPTISPSSATRRTTCRA